MCRRLWKRWAAAALLAVCVLTGTACTGSEAEIWQRLPGLETLQRLLGLESASALTGDVYTQLREALLQRAEQLIIVPEKEEAELPSSYDYRQIGRAALVRDQGDYGTCWAFASLGALETTLLPEEDYDFSPDHLNYHNGYGLEAEDGGSFMMALAYFTSWQGPVLESEDPYGDGESPENLQAAVHVQSARIPEEKDYETIKRTVCLYGGVVSSLYMDVLQPRANSAYYLASSASYYCPAQRTPNHDVVIIGWDDDYPAGNFTKTPPGDGAFICQNSWGRDFGEDGVFYVSYYDVNIGVYNIAYTQVENNDNYDLLYQSDLCGWTGQVSYNTESAYFANVYEAEEAVELEALGFYATGEDTQYRIAVVSDYTDPQQLRETQFVQSGYLQYEGYYTIDLEESVQVEAGHRFALIVWMKTPGEEYQIAVEYQTEDMQSPIDLTDGEGYISSNGLYWESVEETQECNLCLKAYANRRD